MKTIPAAASDAECNKAYVEACAFWMLKSVLLVEDVLEHEEDLAPHTPPGSLWDPKTNQLRSRILSRLYALSTSLNNIKNCLIWCLWLNKF